MSVKPARIAPGVDSSPIWHPKRTSMVLVPLVMWCVARLRRPLVALGIDYPRFACLIETKLTLDFRSDDKGGAGFVTFGLLLIMAITWISSLGVTLLVLTKMPPESWMAILSAHTLFMTLFMLATQYSAMLVDTTDVDVLQSRPIPDRTLFAARLAHVAVYLVSILSTCLFWPLALGWLGYPYWSLVVTVPIVVAQSATTALGIVAIVFALALRIGGPANFQRLALWAQIGLTALMMGGMQVGMAFTHGKPFLEWLRGDSWTRALLPPLQQGGLYALVLGDTSRANMILGALAFVTPLAALSIAVLLASKHFVAGLQGEIARPPSRGARWKKGIYARIAAICTSSRQERAGFDFVLAMSRREKNFLRATVPMLVGFTSMGVAMTINARGLGDVMPRFMRIVPIYMFAISMPGILENWRFSEYFDASWSLRIAPTDTLRPFVLGGIKAILAGMLAPTMLFVGTLLVVLQGVAVLPDVLVAGLVVTTLTIGVVPMLVLKVPFARKLKFGETDFSNLAMIFVVCCLTVACGGLHAVARAHWIGLTVLGVAAAIGAVVAWKRLATISEPVW